MKWESLPPLIVLLALSLLAMPPASLADTGPTSDKTAPITVVYSFPSPEVVSCQLSGEGADYVSVTMNGLPQWSEPGLPVLPFEPVRILLPQGTGVGDIAVSCGKKVSLSGSFLVQPGQQPVPLSYEGEVETLPPDEEVYNSVAPFPGRLYSGVTVQSKRGYRILLLNLHPLEYIPKEGKLSYYESLTVTVTPQEAKQAEGLPIRGLSQDQELVGALVDNPGTLSTYSSPVSPLKGSLLSPGDYEYVIITNEALNNTTGPNNLQALRDEKISRGITATIVTTEWIYANYNGSRPDGGEDNQTRIRNFIIDAYENWNTSYVLLGGDGDGGSGGQKIIPHRGFFCRISSGAPLPALGDITDYDIPADMYYACLDGTFDYNANGTYGEVDDGPDGGEVDLFAEVYVGRAPVDSPTEVQNFVNKTLAYQNISYSDGNLRKVWMVGDYLRFGGPAQYGSSYKDEIKQGSSASGYTTVGFEDSVYAPCYNVSTLYDYPGYNYSTSEITGIINNNTHIINHMGHGSVSRVLKMGNSDVDVLTNDGLYFIGYTQACYCGAFDNRKTTPGNYSGDDCIIEHFVTGAHGAVAFIANSRYGIGARYSTDGPSQHFDREFWDAVLGEDKLNIGVAHQDSKEDNAGRISVPEDRWCYYEINLFGDPELQIKLPGVVYHSHQIDDSSGDNDGYPEPGESVGMSVVLRNTATDTDFLNVTANLSATTMSPTVIFSDDFEGNWSANWTAEDRDPGCGSDYWGQNGNRSHSGNFSAYCAEIGDVPGQEYDNSMDARMYRNISLTGYDAAALSFYYWLKSERCVDYLVVGYVDSGDRQYDLKAYEGDSGGWVKDTIPIPTTATRICFRFYSNTSITAEGAYIDDVVLTGYTVETDPYINITDAYEEYGNISAGNAVASIDDYDFDIDSDCPAEHKVIFILNITASNGGPWTASFVVTILGRSKIEGTTYQANATLLPQANITLKLNGSEIATTASNATGYYSFTINQIENYTVNVTKSGFSYAEKWANVTALDETFTVNFTGMDAPYPIAPNFLYCLKCSNLWLYWDYWGEFALNATRVSDVLYAWTHPA